MKDARSRRQNEVFSKIGAIFLYFVLKILYIANVIVRNIALKFDQQNLLISIR